MCTVYTCTGGVTTEAKISRPHHNGKRDLGDCTRANRTMMLVLRLTNMGVYSSWCVNAE